MKIVILFLLVFCHHIADAQQARETENLKRHAPQLNERGIKESYETALKRIVSLFIETYKDEFPNIGSKKIDIEIVYMDNAALASIENNTLNVSENTPAVVRNLAKLLAHDLLVNSTGRLNLSNPIPIHSHPFAVSPIIPILPSLYDIDNMDFSPMDCPQPKDISELNETFCQYLEVAMHSAVMGFVLAHEISHFALKHKKKQLSQEIKADELAWDFLQNLLKEFEPGDENEKQMLERGFAAVPILLLKHSSATPFYEAEHKPVVTVDEARERQNALYSYMGEEISNEVKVLLTPRRSANNIGKVHIKWELPPEYLIINSVRIPADEIKDRELVIAAGPLRIFAAAKEHGKKKFAYQKIFIKKSASVIVNLEFLKVKDKEPDIGMVRELYRQEKWFDLWLLTSNEEMNPKNPIFAEIQAKASINLGLKNNPLAQWE